MLGLVLMVSAATNIAGPFPLGSGSALHLDGGSFASIPVAIDGSFLLSFWMRRNWLSGSETIFSLNNAQNDVVLLVRSTNSGADSTILVVVNRGEEVDVDLNRQYISDLDSVQFVHFALSYIEGKARNGARIHLAINGEVIFEQQAIRLARMQEGGMRLDLGATQGGETFKYLTTADLDDMRVWSIRLDDQSPPISHLQPVHSAPPTLLLYHNFDQPVHCDFKVTPVLQASIGANGTCRDSKGDAVVCQFIPSTIMASLGGRSIVQVRLSREWGL